MNMPPDPSAGGRARAAKLSPQARREIAQRAARSRWGDRIIAATHTGELKIGDLVLPCSVLEDGRRVLSGKGMLDSLRMSHGGRPNYTGDRLSRFAAGKAMQAYVSEDLAARITEPIIFCPVRGGAAAFGYEATTLADICDAVLTARAEGALQKQQLHIATQAEILVRAFSRVGIIALVDEATGYQDSRDKLALQTLLDRFLRKELAAWAKRFPDEFYQGIFRLRGWKWRGMKVNRPQALAQYTKNLVYARLAPGVLKELEERTPRNEHGRRKAKFHQWLTDDVGHPALAQHLHALIGFMRVATTWEQFTRMVDVAFPKRGDTLTMAFMADAVDVPSD